MYSCVVVTMASSLNPNFKVGAFGQGNPKEMCDTGGKAEPWDGHGFPFRMKPLFTPEEHD